MRISVVKKLRRSGTIWMLVHNEEETKTKMRSLLRMSPLLVFMNEFNCFNDFSIDL